MIVDACTRIWQGAEPWAAQAGLESVSSDAHQRAMSGAGVAFVLGYRSDRLGVHVPAERVLAWVHQAPDSRVGFLGIDPLSASAREDLEAGLAHGLSGVTIAPADAGCRPTDERCREILEVCADRHAPVIISNPGLLTAQSVLEFANPALFDEALREIPGLRLVFGDMGRAYREETLAMIAKHSNAFAEISTVVRGPSALYQALVAAHERGVLGKLLFGSGFPAETPQRAIERIFSVNGFSPPSGGWSTIPREQLRNMIERDTVVLLGLEPLNSRRSAGTNGDTLQRTSRRLGSGTFS
jgi:predicted TIM-barrel fold metal-dependent hydrolase